MQICDLCKNEVESPSNHVDVFLDTDIRNENMKKLFTFHLECWERIKSCGMPMGELLAYMEKIMGRKLILHGETVHKTP